MMKKKMFLKILTQGIKLHNQVDQNRSIAWSRSGISSAERMFGLSGAGVPISTTRVSLYYYCNSNKCIIEVLFFWKLPRNHYYVISSCKTSFKFEQT